MKQIVRRSRVDSSLLMNRRAVAHTDAAGGVPALASRGLASASRLRCE